MNSMKNDPQETSEDKAIFDALEHQPELPGTSDVDAVFLMQLDVPDAIMKKLRAA